jgi:hypothetical protein
MDRTTILTLSSKKEPFNSVNVDLDESSTTSSSSSSVNGIQQFDGDSQPTADRINGGILKQKDSNDTDNANSSAGNDNNGYAKLLSSVGLEGKLKHAVDLPIQRKVSVYDIFCNRELKLDNIVAIGFDMDYTLAQYQQPAFDQLAFDGAKEKLVRKLGYPEEVLDFQYDHQVRKKESGRILFCWSVRWLKFCAHIKMDGNTSMATISILLFRHV